MGIIGLMLHPRLEFPFELSEEHDLIQDRKGLVQNCRSEEGC